ncbi:hypothetical protein [Aquirufa ecclesiirivi]|uniref:hypothetical protein n=1 Tax=Aquirufa ecclesiirivi TaxID=2715124 RepID=UPI0023D885BD|nr:hypothetical protein [Aquirufa ecclesiirivi]MDF0693237.1 hypothetical protein [Aquirufa ecclesiirivi]
MANNNDITTEILHKEIDLIQGVINRMANNSFLLKGWLISLIAVILALTKDTIVATQLSYFNLVLLLPVIVFWYLDAFFLHKEKCYRKLYEWVIENRKSSNNFLYNLNYKRFENKVKSTFRIMFSQTLLPFYGLIFIVLITLALHNQLA